MIGRNRIRQASWIASCGALALGPLRLHGEVHHHDAVLLHQPDEHDDADEGVDGKLGVENDQRQQRAEPRERQRGEDGDRVIEALVQDAQHDVNDQHGQHQQPAHALQGGLEGLAVPG